MTTPQPVGGFGSFTPLTRNPPSVNSSAEKDPRGLKRKRGLDYLSRIPSPPPVCPLGTMASPCVNRTFNPPRSSGTPSTLKTVQTPAPKPVRQPLEDEWVNDEELAMIDTQALHGRPGFVWRWMYYVFSGRNRVEQMTVNVLNAQILWLFFVKVSLERS